MVRNWQTKKFKGFAYIEYQSGGSVKKAMKKYSRFNFKGRSLVCDAVTTNMKKGYKSFKNHVNEGEEDN
jgi:RNA recognition motif-containing protein